MFVADTLTPADVAAIARVREAWLRAINTDDLAGIDAAGAEDLLAFPPHESPRAGIAANREWHRSRIEQFATRLTMTSDELQGGSVWAFERLAYAIELTPRSGGAAVQERGNCFWAWQRQADGSWKVARAIWNSDVPLTPTAP